MSPDLVVLGNLLVDDVVFADGRTRMGQPGGAVLYASLGATLWGLRVGVASWRGDDYPPDALQALAAHGVDLAGVIALGRTGLRTWLLYEGRRRQVIHRLDGPSHAEVSPTTAGLPPGWSDARAFHLAPMPFDVQRDLVQALGRRRGALVSLDPYVLLRSETLEAWRAVLADVDVLFVSEDDLDLPGVAEDPRPALRHLAAPADRLRFVVFKRGAQGGMLYDVERGRFVDWAPRAERVVDPTGAGDAFAGGFLAGCLRGHGPEDALQQAVVAASFALEEWGAAGSFRVTPDEARARRHAWYGA